MTDREAFMHSALPCDKCGEHHLLNEFDPKANEAVVVVSGKHAGARGNVISWSQYGCPVYYRVEFRNGYLVEPKYPDIKQRDNFAPCELLKA